MLSDQQIKAVQQYLVDNGFTTVKVSGAWDITTQNCYAEQCLRLSVFDPSQCVQPSCVLAMPKAMQDALEASSAETVKSVVTPEPVVEVQVQPEPQPEPVIEQQPEPEVVQPEVQPEPVINENSKIDPTLE